MWVNNIARPWYVKQWPELRKLMELPEKAYKEEIARMTQDNAEKVFSDPRLVEAANTANKYVAKRQDLPDFVSAVYFGIYLSRMVRTQLEEQARAFAMLWMAAYQGDPDSSINSMLSMGFGHRFRDTIAADIEAIHDSEFMRLFRNRSVKLVDRNTPDVLKVLPIMAKDPEDSSWGDIIPPPNDKEGLDQLFEWVKHAGFSKQTVERLQGLFNEAPRAAPTIFHEFFIMVTGTPAVAQDSMFKANSIPVPSERSLTNYRSWVVPKDTPGKFRLIQSPNRRLKEIQRNIHMRFSRVDNEADTLVAYYKGADYVKRLQKKRISRPGLVTLDLKDWYHQITAPRIQNGISEYLHKAGALHTLDKKARSRTMKGGDTAMDRYMELLQMRVLQAAEFLLRHSLRAAGKQLARVILFDVLRTLIPQIVFLRRHRETFPHPDHKLWKELVTSFERDVARDELFVSNPDLMFIPMSPKRMRAMGSEERLMTGKLVNTLGTLVPYQATAKLGERTFDAEKIRNVLYDKTDLPDSVVDSLQDKVTLADIQKATGRSIAACRLTIRDLGIDDGPTVFALAQGAPTSGCLANLYFAFDLLNGLRHKLEKLKEENILEGYDILVYSDNLGIFFTPYSGATHEIATRKILKESRAYLKKRNILVNDFKIQDYEGDDKKFLGLLIDEQGQVRVSRAYLREVNQIIIALDKNETANYKGRIYTREDMSALRGMVQWVKRTRGDSPYKRRVKKIRWRKAA